MSSVALTKAEQGKIIPVDFHIKRFESSILDSKSWTSWLSGYFDIFALKSSVDQYFCQR